MVVSKLKQIGDFQKNYQNILLKSRLCNIETLKDLANDIFSINEIYGMIKQHSIDLDSKQFINSLLGDEDSINALCKWAENVANISETDKQSQLKRVIHDNSISSHAAYSIVKNLQQQSGITKIKLDSKNEAYGYCMLIATNDCDNDAISFGKKHNLQLISSSKKTYRFKNDQLLSLQINYNEAKERLNDYDRIIVNEWIDDLYSISSHLYDVGMICCELDIASSFANLSLDRNYVRPHFVSNDDGESEYLNIKGARHPIIESLDTNMSFQANDCLMSEQSNNLLYLISGANMSGKSTYLRSIALLIIMAQSGLYVPCNEMILSVFDSIFVRFGSNDALSKDQSTFMIEMNETSDILKYATKKSLIIMDEVAKSTSPNEGYCIAQAIIRYIHDHIQCRCLFSTHFYECSVLEKELKNLKCYYMANLVNR